MAANRLGDRVNLDQISDDDLPYPGQQAPAGFTEADGIDTPFMAPAQAKPAKGAGLDVGNYDPSKPAQTTASMAPAMIDPPKPKPKMTKQLQRFREAFGVKRIKVMPFTIVRKRPDSDENERWTFQFRALKYDDYQWAVARAADLVRINDISLDKAWLLAVTAISVCAIDVDLEEGARPTPLQEFFEMELEPDLKIQDIYYPPTRIRVEAADMMFMELVDSLFTFSVELTTFVDINILPQTTEVAEEREKEGPLV